MVLFQFLNNNCVSRVLDNAINTKGWVDNPRQRFILEDLNERVHSWWPPSVPFFYLWGSVGSGKTSIINILLECFNGKKERWHYSDLILHLSNNVLKDIKSPKDWNKFVKKQFKRGQLLCIDEWVVEDITQVMLWKNFLPALWARGVYVVVTSNVSVDKIYQNGLGREHFMPTIEMIANNAYIYDLIDTVDYRLNKRTNFRSPFVTKKQKFLTNEVAPKISNQEMVIGDNAVLFFNDDLLCVDFIKAITPPVWRKNYIQWVSDYKTILINNVSMDTINKNQLVNWVRLVDLLYDEGVFVFLTYSFEDSALNNTKFNWPERTKSRVMSWINHQNLWAQQNL